MVFLLKYSYATQDTFTGARNSMLENITQTLYQIHERSEELNDTRSQWVLAYESCQKDLGDLHSDLKSCVKSKPSPSFLFKRMTDCQLLSKRFNELESKIVDYWGVDSPLWLGPAFVKDLDKLKRVCQGLSILSNM